MITLKKVHFYAWIVFSLQTYVNLNQYDDGLYANVHDLADE